ncbi:iron-sulfur cluster assembly accessory protein [Gloeocapsa sp. PCC 7428]|uniref:HesB/IscA family protein n=1 Tax=Gloeocapsa sp. PCC 7428 TaxID=1173026 RepID=UPI0002A5E0BC|nr:iron-sulfur cluster assembly accessory protein [Gloeocapsa sp. PCC 7428]AFZ32201.1 iron-sulfur cluster assembly accessory protein [Gloeocapsa sp. PCC 7428]
MVRLSTSAAKEIQRLQAKQHNQNVFFRLKVQAGGCSSLLYNMEFDTSLTPSDRVYDCSGITVVVDAQSIDYIHDLLLDYSEDLMGGGFRFHNPQAIATCSCGNSFSIASDASTSQQ